VGSGTVFIIDDDDSMRVALARLLACGGYQVRGYASAGDFLLEQALPRPGCILLDVLMPGPSGLDLQRALARQTTPLPIVFLSGHGDIPKTVRAIKAGASDFLTKPVERDVLFAAVAGAVAQDVVAAAEFDHHQYVRTRYATLTAREREVFGHVVAGRLSKQIAGDLGTSVRTIKAHRSRIMEKLKVASLLDLGKVAELLQGSDLGIQLRGGR